MLRPFLLLSLLLIASCAADKKTAASSAASSSGATKSLSEQCYGPPIKQNAKGEWPSDMERDSALTGERKSAYFTEKSTLAKAYKTGEYTKTSWWGKKQVQKPAYTGNTDGSRFKSSSRLQGVTATEAGTAAKIAGPYKTGTYGTHAAHEDSVKRIDRPADAETAARRRDCVEPEVNTWKQQRALDLKTTKSILGRD